MRNFLLTIDLSSPQNGVPLSTPEESADEPNSLAALPRVGVEGIKEVVDEEEDEGAVDWGCFCFAALVVREGVHGIPVQ